MVEIQGQKLVLIKDISRRKAYFSRICIGNGASGHLIHYGERDVYIVS